jgi:arginine utilization protein RocB
MNKKRIQGAVEQSERANDREALVAKARQRRSDSRGSKVDVLTWGDLASRLKGRRSQERSEESAEAVVATPKPVKKPEAFVECEGPNRRTG